MVGVVTQPPPDPTTNNVTTHNQMETIAILSILIVTFLLVRLIVSLI